MLSFVLVVVLYVFINIFFLNVKGVEGVVMVVWVSDFIVMILFLVYVLIMEIREGGKWKEGGWWD